MATYITKLNNKKIKDVDTAAQLAMAKSSLDAEISKLKNADSDLRALINGKQNAKSYNSLAEMITALNRASSTEFELGNNVYIVASDIPDFWIGKISTTKSTGTESGLIASGYNGYQIGYYTLYQLETYIDISGIKVNSDEITKIKNWANNYVYLTETDDGNYQLNFQTFDDGTGSGTNVSTLPEVKLKATLVASVSFNSIEYYTLINKFTDSSYKRYLIEIGPSTITGGTKWAWVDKEFFETPVFRNGKYLFWLQSETDELNDGDGGTETNIYAYYSDASSLSTKTTFAVSVKFYGVF